MTSFNFIKSNQHWFVAITLLLVILLIYCLIYHPDQDFSKYTLSSLQGFTTFSSAGLEKIARQGFTPFSSAGLERIARQGFTTFSSAGLEKIARQGFKTKFKIEDVIPKKLLTPYKEGFNSDILEKTAFDIPISSSELNPYNDPKTITSNMLLQKALN